MAGVRLPLATLAALVVPVVAGLAWMTVGGAPTAWIAVNALALVLALALATLLPLPRSQRGVLVLAGALVLGLWATALAGVPVEGVRRWIGLGPLRLHLGYLILPLLVTLAARLPARSGAALIVASLMATMLQPDRAATVALTASAAVLALTRRDGLSITALVIGLGACVAAIAQPDHLAPVRFVEGVQRDALTLNPAAGLALVAASLTPLLLLRRAKVAAAPLAAFLLAAGLMAFAGSYPAILIGYGAAPILGFGLALAALRCQSESQ